jgi:hypothetical protein
METAVETVRHHLDRREAPRLESVADHRIRRARIRPGYGAVVIDASPRSVLLETHRRLVPGSVVELQMEIGTAERLTMRGRIVRSSVSRLCATSVSYRSAVLFDRHLPWFVNDHARPVHGFEERAGREHLGGSGLVRTEGPAG